MTDEARIEEQVDRKPRILIAEDEMIIAADLERMLTGVGYESAGTFMSGEEVLEEIDEARPDLVLMDIRLRGELSGIEVAAQIRERYDIPVVYLTGYAEEMVLQEAKLTGPFGYVGKPVRERELRATIEMALYRHEMEQKLRESEAHLAQAQRLAHLGSYQVEVPKGEVIWSAETFRIVGRDAEKGEPSIEEYYQSIHPDDLLHVQHLLEESYNEMKQFDFEFRIIREDGSVRHIHSVGEPVGSGDGVVARVVGTIHDITDRKRAEEALKESEEKYSVLVEQARDGVVVMQDNELKFASRGLAEITGYSTEELLSMPFWDVLVPENRDAVAQTAKLRLVGGPVPSLYEVPFQHKDGTVKVVEVSVSLIPYQGNPATLAVVRDITERKTGEEALRESETRYRQLFENMSSGVAIYEAKDDGQDFVFADLNRAGERIDGVRREDLISQSVLDVFPGVKEFGLFDVLQRVWRTGEPAHHPTSLYQDERIVGWRENYVYRLPSGEVVAVYDDITERKTAEETMRESEQQLKEAQAMGRIGNWEFDLENQEIRWSDQTYELYERDPALGPPTDEEEAAYYSPEQMGMLRGYARRVIEEGSEFEYDLQAELPSGKLARFAATMRPVKDESGRTVRLFGTVQDITERKQAEEQIRANLAEKEVLLREIHHRVKNNLQIISSLLRLQSDALESEEAAEAFQESRNRVHAMARVHEHLYRSESLAEIEMASYIKQLTGHVRDSYRAYGIVVKVEVADVVLDVDRATPCGLLINELVSNAMKHAFPAQDGAGPDAPRGEILVALRSDGDELELVVSDDGTGLPGDVDIETTKSLGLRLVGILTRQLRGTMELDRDGESGTSFRITFPAQAPEVF